MTPRTFADAVRAVPFDRFRREIDQARSVRQGSAWILRDSTGVQVAMVPDRGQVRVGTPRAVPAAVTQDDLIAVAGEVGGVIREIVAPLRQRLAELEARQAQPAQATTREDRPAVRLMRAPS